MAFLTINGWPINVQDETASTEEVVVGESERAFSGQLRATKRTFKRQWTVETPPLTYANSIATESLLRGLGFTIPFNTDIYATNGLAPSPGYTITFNLTGGPDGSNYITITSGTTLNYVTAIGSLWTLMVWKKTAGTWTHYAKTSVGTVYTNGVVTGAAAFLSMSSGTATITASAGNIDFDDFVILPFVVTADQMTYFGVNQSFSPLPRLDLSGSIVGGVATEVYADVESSEYLQAYLGGAWQGNARRLTIMFSEA